MTMFVSARGGPESSGNNPLRRWGKTSWNFVGIALAFFIAYSLLVALCGLVVPLLLAIVVGTLAVPLVDRLEMRRVPRRLAALFVVVALVVALFGTLLLVFNGLVHQGAEIQAVVTSGTDVITEWFEDLRIRVPDSTAIVGGVESQGSSLLTGAATWLTSVFSGAMAFAIGTFLALFMLYYILADWPRVRSWTALHLGVPTDLGNGIVDDATAVVRRGFGVLTINSLITTLLIGLAMVTLGLPLAVEVMIVTFITSFIPYLGVILSGIFAFVVALGSGGLGDAAVLLLVILVVQGIIQTIAGNQLASDRLHLHPLPSIISSVCGVAIAGLLGAMLSAPAVALAIAISHRVEATQRQLVTDGSAASGGGTA